MKKFIKTMPRITKICCIVGAVLVISMFAYSSIEFGNENNSEFFDISRVRTQISHSIEDTNNETTMKAIEPEIIEIETESQIIAVINEWYDGNNFWDTNEYFEMFDKSEVNRIVDIWNLSGYDWENTTETNKNGIYTLDLYFKKRDVPEQVEVSQITKSNLETQIDNDINWLLQCTMAEAGNSYIDAYYVASCIINRAEEYGGIIQAICVPGQFAVYTSGAMWEAIPGEICRQAVYDALSEPNPYIYYFASYDAHSGYATLYDITDEGYYYTR